MVCGRMGGNGRVGCRVGAGRCRVQVRSALELRSFVWLVAAAAVVAASNACRRGGHCCRRRRRRRCQSHGQGHVRGGQELVRLANVVVVLVLLLLIAELAC